MRPFFNTLRGKTKMGLFNWLFNEKRNSSEELPPEIAAIFEKIHQFMEDESLQNSGSPFGLQEEMRSGGSCDEIIGATGEFGRNPHNPIPVNGPIGELIYLSQLEYQKSSIIGHRLGSFRKKDVYEVVTLDGSKWDLLFFDPYHLRKSKRLPSGYTRSTSQPFLLATNYFLPDFPGGIQAGLRECTERFFGVPLVSPKIRAGHQNFARSLEHKNIMSDLHLETRATRL